MKRCNHKFCSLVADAASKTCWLEAEDIPDPVNLLRLIVEDPGAVVLPATVMVEVRKFLRKFEEIDSPELSGEFPTLPPSLMREQAEVTDTFQIPDDWSMESVVTQSGEGEA